MKTAHTTADRLTPIETLEYITAQQFANVDVFSRALLGVLKVLGRYPEIQGAVAAEMESVRAHYLAEVTNEVASAQVETATNIVRAAVGLGPV